MAFHPSELVREELEARGWTRDQLADAMTDAPENQVAWQINRLAVDMYLEVGPTNSGIRLGDIARRFARAFGTSPELWWNLEDSWLKSLPPVPLSEVE